MCLLNTALSLIPMTPSFFSALFFFIPTHKSYTLVRICVGLCYGAIQPDAAIYEELARMSLLQWVWLRCLTVPFEWLPACSISAPTRTNSLDK
jgi:hypothetical protein